MNKINQIHVFNQEESGGILGRDGCGINTFKNSILSLLLAHRSINEKQFTRLLNSKDLVDDIYGAVGQVITKIYKNDSYIDSTITEMSEMFDMAKAGKIDLSKYGIGKSTMSSLALNRDGKQNISITNVGDYCGYALLGFEEDLLSASTLAKLARTEGEFCHAFAIGYQNNMLGHWMTVVLEQDKYGKKQWLFMDSYKNQTRYKDSLVNKIDTVLNSSPLELKKYLIDVYDNSSDANRLFVSYSNLETNRSIAGKAINSTNSTGIGEDIKDREELCIDDEDREEYINYISNRLIFMENADWLKKDIGEEELKRVKRLHVIIKFMIDNDGYVRPEIKDKLTPICVRLEEVIALNRITETIRSSGVIPTQTYQNAKERGVLQSVVAIAAVENGKPTQGPELFKKLISQTDFIESTTNDEPGQRIVEEMRSSCQSKQRITP